MLTTHPFDDDKLREECGIFGVWGADTASAVVALGLHALQHRGQEAAGITSWDGQEFHSHCARMGHVAGNFDRDEIIAICQLPGARSPVGMSDIPRRGKPLSATSSRSMPISRPAASRLRTTATSPMPCPLKKELVRRGLDLPVDQ